MFQVSAEKVTDVYKTMDYTLFHTIAGNRSVNQLHVERIANSMDENQLVTPIIVNENYEIIDGQHRYRAISNRNLPLYFMVCEGYGLNEVHRLNERSNTWNTDDFLDGYALMGKEDYLILQEFVKKNYISPSQGIMLLRGEVTQMKANKDFKGGAFKVYEIEEAQQFINCLNDFKPYFTYYKVLNFMKAFKKIYDTKKYSHDNMVKKLEYMGGTLQPRNTQEQYMEMLCEIYNMRLHTSKRIYFDGMNEIQGE
jgi:hypothetical protein